MLPVSAGELYLSCDLSCDQKKLLHFVYDDYIINFQAETCYVTTQQVQTYIKSSHFISKEILTLLAAFPEICCNVSAVLSRTRLQ